MLSADRPAAANYDADPQSELAIFSNGTFKIAYDNTAAAITTVSFAPGLYPVPGHWS